MSSHVNLAKSDHRHQFFVTELHKTLELGVQLAKVIRPGDIIALYGDLGAGKTSLSRGIIQALVGDEIDVPSPTYTIVQTYESARGLICHFDLYRIEVPDELIEIGFEDALDDICLIEWPDRADHYLPSARLSIEITHDEAGRQIALIPGTPEWEKRLNEHFGTQ